jgi:type VI secretion system protein ImpE
MNAKELYQAGRLADAIAAAVAEVKKNPADTGLRLFLAELAAFAGDFDRTERQLEALTLQDPQLAMEVATFRQLLRAEEWRQQFYREGRVPEVLDLPSPQLQCRLEASIRIREGQPGEAAKLLQAAEAERPAVRGTSGGKAFDDLRDVDDLTSSIFEVLTTTGKYYWIPMDQVESMEFRPPKRPRDLLWREVHMIVRNGPDGVVYLPVLYAGAAQESDDQIRLGRMTDWRGSDEEPVRGVGQRVYLVGEDDKSILELEQLTFEEPGEPRA